MAAGVNPNPHEQIRSAVDMCIALPASYTQTAVLRSPMDQKNAIETAWRLMRMHIHRTKTTSSGQCRMGPASHIFNLRVKRAFHLGVKRTLNVG